MLTREEYKALEESLKIMYGHNLQFGTGVRGVLDFISENFVEEPKPQRQTSREKVITILQILIDVLGYTYDQHKWGRLPLSIEDSIETADELLQELKAREKEMKANA